MSLALGNAWGKSDERGVFKTVDGGKNWRKVLYVNDITGCSDLIVDPTNPNKLIATMWEFSRKPFVFQSGGKGSGMYISLDGGETWERRTDKDGLPKGDLGRIGVAISKSKPNVMYAIVEAKENAFYRSTDGGYKWSKMADKGFEIDLFITQKYMLIQKMKIVCIQFLQPLVVLKMVEKIGMAGLAG